MLPFIAGIAAGAAVVYALGNRKEIQAGIKSGVNKAKELACDVKKGVDGTLESIKSKKSSDIETKEGA
ncbi:hypothetical protein [Sulfurospirillum barnesii]|uniref:YtxH-like protein n=1 Tax=Sulfurospirillum barnesii (strain ATCC 700032 / DSM 10660 / SES-3) TaxID=760154 RepID=I3XY65_SULBS|nr:hypothetical protein [Sulfurospirillum barnesii]AFL68889.1 hypothetical protein Sulba_1601 [Sulfurospirillum barnesii SES-3]